VIFLRSVKIHGFRSISSLELTDLAGINALVGRNSSGKSNILRALNLFFTDQVDSGNAFDFDQDLHAPLRRSKKRRQLIIEAEFLLPENFNIRSSLPKTTPPIERQFIIRRVWELDKQRRVSNRYELLIDGLPVVAGEEAAPTLLRLITFRYIPNRVSPAALLREEAPSLVRALARKLSGVAHSDLMERTRHAASQLLSATDRSLRLAGAPFQKLLADTPATLAELLSVRGFRALDNFGAEVSSEGWGYGHQAFFSYHVLKEADTDYSRTFGWRQATLWAVEEPEAGLHRDLEVSLIALLKEWVDTPSHRLQILYTTHSSTFAQQSDKGYWIETTATGTIARSESPLTLQTRAEKAGVSYAASPVLSFQDRPLVIVEGHYDVEALTHTQFLTDSSDLRFITPRTLDPNVAEGVSGIIALLDSSRRTRPLRRKDMPILVLLDWDVSDKELSQAKTAYGTDGDRFVLRASKELANPRLGEDWRGIERFYSLPIIQASIDNDDIQVATHPRKPWSISATALHRGKGVLCAQLKSASTSGELPFLTRLLDELRTAALKARDSYLRIYADGTVMRTSNPPSKGEMRSRSDLILSITWGGHDSCVFIFSNLGYCHLINLSEFSMDRRETLENIRPTLAPEERPIGAISNDTRVLPELAYAKPVLGEEYEAPYPHLLLGTKKGHVTRITMWPLVEAKTDKRQCVRLELGDQVVSFVREYADDAVGLLSKHGYGLIIDPQSVTLKIGPGKPEPGIALREEDELVSTFVIDDNARIILMRGDHSAASLPADELGSAGQQVVTGEVVTVRYARQTFGFPNEALSS
jgi:hypothetical protein